jgi:hypothetical protein
MTIYIPSVNTSTDSFLMWINNSNKAFSALSNNAVTTNSNNAIGNSGITGLFTANALFANMSFNVGYSTQNVVMSNTSLIFNNTSTINAIYSRDGFIINYAGGNTRYTTASLSIAGTTNINSTNVTSINASFSNTLLIGNSTIRTTINSSAISVNTLNVSKFTLNSISFGTLTTEANSYFDYYGLRLNWTPSNGPATNTFINGQGLVTSGNVYANGIYAENGFFIRDKASGGYVKAFTVQTTTTTTTTTPPSGPPVTTTTTKSTVVNESNTVFASQNNYFSYGLTSNGNVGIAVGIPDFKGLSPLHIARQRTSGIKALNTDSMTVIESDTANTFVEFRHKDSVGSLSGMIFVDTSQSGYLVYNTNYGSQGGTLRAGAYNAINFEVGGTDTLFANGVASKPVMMQVTPSYVSSNVALRLNGSTSSYTELVSNSSPTAGGIRFTLPSNTGTANFVMTATDGAGKLGWANAAVLITGSSLSLNTFTTSLNGVIGTSLKVQTSLGVGTEPSGVAGEIRATDDITAFYSSDISLKTNIKPIENALEKIDQINGVSFDWTDSHLMEHGGEDDYFNRKHDVGVIAQEIEKVLPEVVGTRENGIKAVKYDRIVALLIQGIKELKSELDEVKSKNCCSCGGK